MKHEKLQSVKALVLPAVLLAGGWFLAKGRLARVTAPAPVAAVADAGSHSSLRTYMSLQYLTLGKATAPVDDVEASLVLSLPGMAARELPKQGEAWTLSAGKSVPLFQAFEIPSTLIHNDQFSFTIQMRRKGQSYDPCVFHAENLSQFNRIYVCRTVEGDSNQKLASMPALAVQVSVFTNRNLTPSETARRLVRR